MNQTPITPESTIKKRPQSTVIVISILAGILILLAGLGAYIWSQNLTMSNSGTNSSSVPINSTTTSVMNSMDNSAMNSARFANKSGVDSQVSTGQAGNLQTLSCPSFDISINTDKYQVGFTKFTKEFTDASRDEAGKVSLEQAKQDILLTQKINCIIKATESNQLVKFVEKGYENGCWFCGPGNIQAINLSTLYGSDSNKVISTTLTKNTNGLEGTIKKMSFEAQDNSLVNYNSITFKIKDVDYELNTESKSDNPTDAENEALLKDALEVFNSIKIK